MSSPSNRRKRKVPNACQRCRVRKVRCSGQQPCLFCESRDLQCVFEEKEKTVTVPQSLVDGLRSRIAALERTTTAGLSSEDVSASTPASVGGESCATASHNNDPAPANEHMGIRHELRYSSNSLADKSLPNSLTSYESPIIVSEHGQYRCVGHSSNWSLNQRLRAIIGSSYGDLSALDEIPTTDGMSYQIAWKSKATNISHLQLPSLEYAEYLSSTVYLHLGPLYRLFEKTKFIHKLRNYYADQRLIPPPGNVSDLWRVQMIMIFAFGEAMLSRESSAAGPAGIQYFLSALDALPNAYSLHFEPILAIEVLCLISLFAQGADMKSTSYTYIGIALRIAVLQGLNRELPYNADSPVAAYRSQDHSLWWTVYTIDCRLAAIMGLKPTSYNAVKPPLNSMENVIDFSDQSWALKIHVILASNLGEILNVVYDLKGPLGRNFITSVQSVLSELSATLKMLNHCFPIDTVQLDSTRYRTAASLHLLSHQCVILAVRPVLFSLVERRLATLVSFEYSAAVKSLLSMGVESAKSTIKILESLRSRHLLDIFFLSDLDSTLSAAILLVMVDIIESFRPEYSWGVEMGISLFDSINARGNVPASHYKKTLMELVELRNKILSISENDNPSVSNAAEVTYNTADHLGPTSIVEQRKASMQVSSGERDGEGMFRLDPDMLQSAIDGLEFGLNDSGLHMDMEDNWLWSVDFMHY